MNFVPLHLHTVYSLLDGISKPDKIATRCQELGYTSCGITDHGSISAAIKFIKSCTKAAIKPIIGCEFYVTEQDASIKDKANRVSHQLIFAKNLKGWKKLVKLVTISNNEENFYYKPRIDRRILESINPDGDLIAISGHPGSTIDTASDSIEYALYLQSLFGTENVFLEIQRIYSPDLPFCLDVSNKIREVATKTGLRTVATGDSHYVNREDAILQRITLCSSLKLTMRDIHNKMKHNEDIGLEGFFKSDRFHIPSITELIEVGHTEEEINNTQLIADMCETYDITSPPKLPKFIWTYGHTELQWLETLCDAGMMKKGFHNKPEYECRLKYELSVIEEANLAGYFLIVQDYVQWAKDQGWLVGPGRGSAAGCLISYLIGITGIDPIKYNLLFERFYNAGRKGSLPDIDMDFPASKRDMVIDYIRNKYGSHNVAQIATYGRMQGRGALKEVLRNNNVCDFQTMDVITENIPNEAEISDLLEEEKEDSIIRWTLRNEPAVLQDWCRLEENEELTGEYAKFFGYAIELEGVLRSSGKHAAGIIVSSDVIGDICPMLRDKNTDNLIAAMDMKDLEAMGFVKLDILGISALDKLQSVNDLLSKGRLL